MYGSRKVYGIRMLRIPLLDDYGRGIEVGDGRAKINFSALQGIGQSVAHAVGIDEDDLVLVDALKEVDYVVIVAHLDVAGLEVL